MASESPTFRPDIEGLRGVAILLVVLFHAGVSGLAGGFVGVDVFFVLSGFFITGLLARDLGADTLDLRTFYGKRALRLLPPLLVVLTATIAAVMWLYAPIDRAPIADSARSVALSAGNVHFARESVDYFSSGENPLLHTWSLAVEQQFYLLWPLLLLLFTLGAERWRAGHTEDAEAPNRALLVGVAIVGALSLGGSLWLTRTAQPWAFFGMPTRLWEFSLGGGLALVMRTRSWRAGVGTGLQVAGLAAIGWAVATYDRATPYPGLAAVLPALGGAALLVGGRDAADGVISRVLGAPLLRWFGRMSYAWYLWHWPLVGLGAVLQPGLGVAGKLAWSAGALALAWVTYHTVERSSRDGWLARIPTERLTGAALVASVAAALVAHGALLAARRQAARPEQRTFAVARADRMKHDCWATTVDDMKGPCEFGDTRSSTVVALLGDSHAEHWLGGLDRVGRERGWKIVAMVKGGCPVADVSEVPKHRRERHYLECARYREAMLRRIVAMKPAIALLSSWDHYVPVDGEANDWQMSPAAWQRGLRRTYARLTAAGIPTVAMRGTPRTWFDVPSCLSRRAARLPFAGDCTYARDAAASRVAIDAQTAAGRGLPVRFVDMNDQICATARCSVVRNGTVVFTDDNHLTASFTRSLAPVLGPRLVAAAAKSGVRLP